MLISDQSGLEPFPATQTRRCCALQFSYIKPVSCQQHHTTPVQDALPDQLRTEIQQDARKRKAELQVSLPRCDSQALVLTAD